MSVPLTTPGGPMSPRCLVCICGLALGGAARADVVSLTAVKDNTLIQDVNGALSNGAGDGIFVGNTGDAVPHRAVLAFNLSGIPAGSAITAATLTLTVTRTRADPQSVTAHRILASWGEGSSVGGSGGGGGAPAATGDATWLHRFYNSQLWTSAGGDFTLSPSAEAIVGDVGAYSWSSAGLIADIQGWVNNPASNFGWLMRGVESGVTTSKRFASREFSVSSARPTLVVTFTPPSGTGACCLAGGTCQILSPSACAGQAGVYQGDGAPCTPNPCSTAAGACCLSNGSCLSVTQAVCVGASGVYQGDSTLCSAISCPVALMPFVDPLTRPAVATPTSGVPGGAASYFISITEFSQVLHRDLPATRVWGYDTTYPGSTIEAATDQPVNVVFVSDIRDEQFELRTSHYLPVDLCMHGPNTLGSAPRTVPHLHGAHVEARSDGYPTSTILPGEYSGVFNYSNHQPAAALWYHDHALGITRLNVYMGLAGFYIIRDPAEQSLGLPAGEYEIPLAIQDRSFNVNGTLRYPAAWDEMFFGDSVVVNGKVWPYLNVKQGKYRFRLLNGANSRTFRLALSNAAPITVIGGDGGLLPAPVPVTQLTIAPGERYDVVIDFAPFAAGTQIILSNSAPAPYPGVPGIGVVPNVMKFVVQGTAGFTGPIPAALRPMTALRESDAAVQREFTLRKMSEPCAGFMWAINDLMFDDITERPRLGTTEVWSFVNRSDVSHPMHMHLVHFQILDRQSFQLVNGVVTPVGPRVPPAPEEAGWKDTARVDPSQIVRVIARFDDYTGLYPYHCHILEHEDHEMMRQMGVTCYANCDASTVPPILNTVDFTCFLNSFNSGNAYANCDRSTTAPVLNIQDFICFINRFVGGCS